ncbi:hypothetical protein CLAFUW4_14393 [Fulvia fulva]|uniref:Heterokaryon incompatibility domain-containing protein n=1 Tax=Passalora fulva TaxID=5499 RepID=A0A9Q8PMW1_PASFU|nr:uncharacterized protein CLAFUR5_14223 [Fulvia fulva]UJO25309.1 hypothetical protein CLAFUR5_14223 [Fulvia fulva]WPV22462.1 hypothetical protein CLAFUW4_14393 [Fulvia fulva]
MVQACVTERTLWIDAICINRADEVGKAHQIANTDEIFSKAVQVLVYHGLEDKLFKQGIFSLRNVWEVITSTGCEHYSDIDHFTHEELDDSMDLDALAAVFAKPWFSRGWTVQEFVLARKCICVLADNSAIDVEFIVRLANWTYDLNVAGERATIATALSQRPGVPNAQARLWLSASHRGGHNRRPIDALRCARDLSCYDVRDKIFGMFAILQSLVGFEKRQLHLVMPDYSKEPYHVIRDASRFVQETSASPIEILEWVSHGDEADIYDDAIPSCTKSTDHRDYIDLHVLEPSLSS